jgi:hypothetical protein
VQTFFVSHCSCTFSFCLMTFSAAISAFIWLADRQHAKAEPLLSHDAFILLGVWLVCLT